MAPHKLRLATRGSRLALTQSEWVAASLRTLHPGLEVELVIIQTTGDKILDSPLARIGGKGLFTREIEQALLDGRADAAVHSLKDLPTEQPAGLCLAAVTAREHPADVLLAARLVDWRSMGPEGRIGTSSLRRRAQLHRVNPNVQVVELRGNVPTRVRKMLAGEYDAIVLAGAGMRRLGEHAPYVEEMQFDEMLPAPGQGALGLQARAGDDVTAGLLAPLADRNSTACCAAERGLLSALGGGCQVPLAALGEVQADGLLRLRGRVLAGDGSAVVEGEISGKVESAAELGAALAERLLARGADRIVAQWGNAAAPGFDEAVARGEALLAGGLGGCRVLVTRDEDADGPLSCALRDHGADPLCFPLVKHGPAPDAAALREACTRLASYDLAVFTSSRAVEAMSAAGADWGTVRKIAAVGAGTAERLREAGADVWCEATDARAEGLLEALDGKISADGWRGMRVIFPCGNRARRELPDGLSKRGAVVDEVVAYSTASAVSGSALARRLAEAPVAAAVFCSPSAVEAFRDAMGPDAAGALRGVVVASMGPTTSSALGGIGLSVDVEAEERSFVALARELAERFRAGKSSY